MSGGVVRMRNTASGAAAAADAVAPPDEDAIYERFNVNQYYNAVEDEQLYMDEYTSLIHRYNEFIVNGTALYSRMEQTLREEYFEGRSSPRVFLSAVR